MERPNWLNVKNVKESTLIEMKQLLDRFDLHTICENGNCPNVGICFSNKTATFMILGEVCTRNCTFCNVESGQPQDPEENESDKIVEAASLLKLKHIVITSVTRDDLFDGGAYYFASAIKKIRATLPESTVEVLVPDFKGSMSALQTVLNAGPDVLGHNLETVPRLYRIVRQRSDYFRSLRLLKQVKEFNPKILTKSGLMLGLGEKQNEVFEVLEDLRRNQCDIVTIGQYLQPSSKHATVKEYVHPEVFEAYLNKANEMGFSYVYSGPFVRSSYMAHEVFLEKVIK